jgi:hypothetical protein
MDVSSLATALIGAKVAQLQLAAAAKMMKMNAASDASIAQLVDAAQANADKLANVSAGIGANLDISA